MARISDNVLPPTSHLGLTLDRYQELMGLHGGFDMCAFNGINRPTDRHDNQCSTVVTQSQRDQLAMYLVQAEEKRETILGFYLGYKWTIGEDHVVTGYNPYTLRNKHLVAIGYPTYTEIEMGVVLDWGVPPFMPTSNEPNDPVYFTITTSVSTSEIVVTYPGETAHIHPTSIVDNGDGTMTIGLVRCRCVKPSYNGDWDDPPSYYDNDVFLVTVDVWRYWANPELGAQYLWRIAGCQLPDCASRCQSVCWQVSGEHAHDLSIVHVWPATYSAGVWTRASCWTYAGSPDLLRVSYRSGLQTMSNEIYTARLAHTLMPRPPCSCDIIKQRWQDDRIVNQRGVTPYGSMQGAVDTWVADSQARIGHGGMLV